MMVDTKNLWIEIVMRFGEISKPDDLIDIHHASRKKWNFGFEVCILRSINYLGALDLRIQGWQWIEEC